MSQHFYRLQIEKIIRETPDAVSIRLSIPDENKSTFEFKAGQYITLRRVFRGKEVRRSYSISSTMKDPYLQISVKKVKGGVFSTWLCDTLTEGEEISCSEPEGKFTAEWDPKASRCYYFISAGSGITPIMSLIKTGLEKEPASQFNLLYGNRKEEGIMFKSELDSLVKTYTGQLHVLHSLSSLKKGLARRLFGSSREESEFLKGRIDDKKIETFLEQFPSRGTESHFFLCGPGPMILSTEKYLNSINGDSFHIHKEYFTPLDGDGADSSHFTTAKLKATLDGQTYETEILKGKTVLEALISVGADPPYSCTSGVCSTCAAKVLKGKVEMDTCLALDESEIEDGIVLTCQSHPTTEELEVDYNI